jgi:protein-S-isoprenylcysteine O-methyltransferase Ste14
VVHQIGYVLNNLSTYNITVFVGATLFQVMRIYREEQFLVSDPAYRNYMTRTRWRLIPGLF